MGGIATVVQDGARVADDERGAEHFDVIIVGAGLSGIGAAYHLQKELPQKSYVILEGRKAMGGTWDLFRYPGVRSDSDMYTLGYSFRPWKEAKAIADGPSIRNYIRETAQEHGIDRKIRYESRAKRAMWSPAEATWTLEVEGPEAEQSRVTCKFLYMCSGYYDYNTGYLPAWPGIGRFGGTIVHPQKWPQDLDYTRKRVVVIGSGATAVTLVPAMAEKAEHVVLLQRSPSYILSLPAKDMLAERLRGKIPARLAYTIVRWKNVLVAMYLYQQSRKHPEKIKNWILGLAQKALGPNYDTAKHFTPRYNPWDQRLCFVPDEDLFQAIRSGKASMVTDEIETFTEAGLKLKSGEELLADIIVTATGLKVQLMGGMEVWVDGEQIHFPRTLAYKGMMYSDVPNLASSFGYTNASWTLKSDLTAEYVCRLLKHMDACGYDVCVPRVRDESIQQEPAIDFSSGYIQRAMDVLPKQGSKRPWRLHQNYALDLLEFRFSSLEDGAMEFSRVKKPVSAA
ncbi:MAG TPA: NAD(P)/FAD-dependent oxidoreductase [Candidatus Eisenbacteria bacterium]|nr:NAD(P)/FAD-dependent oxidoreductase [Candidatus Eisenbacteria bacterium]